MTEKHLARPGFLILCLLAGAGLLNVPAAEAQTLTAFYPVKVVCGFVPGNVPPLAGQFPFIGIQPNTDRDQEPGHYATIVNVLHNQFQSNSVQVWFVSDTLGAVSVPLLIPASLGPFQSFDVGCTDLAPVLGLGVGAPFEGWLVIFVTNPAFSVSPVYSYASQNGFVDHQLFQVGAAGSQLFRLTSPTAPNPFDLFFVTPAPVPVPLLTPGQPGDVEASGAGGLGLGASIDVEVVDAVPLASPMSASDVADRMSSLDFQYSE